MNLDEYNKKETNRLLAEINRVKSLIEHFENSGDLFSKELENYRKILKGLIDELNSRKK